MSTFLAIVARICRAQAALDRIDAGTASDIDWRNFDALLDYVLEAA